MEETIRQLENQEIIEVAPGSEIPDDLQAILERSNQPPSKVVSPSAALQDSAPKILDDSAPNRLTNSDEKPGRMKVEEQPMVKEQKATSRSSAMDEKVRKESRFLAAMGRPAKKGTSALLFPTVPDDYTGFMVQILVSQEPLATLDPTLNQFPVIRVEESKHGEDKYLVGTFTEIIDALEYFDEKIQESYPNAKIIEFISGKRL